MLKEGVFESRVLCMQKTGSHASLRCQQRGAITCSSCMSVVPNHVAFDVSCAVMDLMSIRQSVGHSRAARHTVHIV